jgi:5-methylcytosine-specific restriction endonuclease McrA
MALNCPIGRGRAWHGLARLGRAGRGPARQGKGTWARSQTAHTTPIAATIPRPGLARRGMAWQGTARCGKARLGRARHDKDIAMRRRRQPRELWRISRKAILTRDAYRCVRCGVSVTSSTANIDHIVPLSKGGTNSTDNLRTLCRPCHVLRARRDHQGMIWKALRDGIIPANWRELVWDD